MLVFLPKLYLVEIQVRYLTIFLLFLMLKFGKVPFLVLHINDLPVGVIRDIAIYAECGQVFNCKCDQEPHQCIQ